MPLKVIVFLVAPSQRAEPNSLVTIVSASIRLVGCLLGCGHQSLFQAILSNFDFWTPDQPLPVIILIGACQTQEWPTLRASRGQVEVQVHLLTPPPPPELG